MIPNSLCFPKLSHEIAKTAGLSEFSFGEEDVDRHVVVYKKEFTPGPDELNAYRKGIPWNPDSVKQVYFKAIISILSELPSN